jgi:glycosyltransferase involved in cell wall biosynthesis
MPPELHAAGEASLASPAALALTGKSAARYVLDLRRAIAVSGASIIHSNGMKMHVLAALARPRHTSLVWHVRDFVGARRGMRRLLALTARRAHLAIANSKAVGHDVERALPRLPVHVVYNAIDVERFRPKGEALPLEGDIRVGIVATYARWKGQDVFLRAAHELTKTSTLPMRFYIVGSPVYRTAGSQFTRAELESLATSLGVRDRVTFIDFVADPEKVYRALDIVVHASTEPEPFGRAVVEAMATGRAVVASTAGGTRELFIEGVDALGAPPGDVPALAAAIERLARDPKLRRRLGDAAHLSAVARFGRARLAPDVLDAYARTGLTLA